MPKLILTVAETNESVTRPIVMSITRDLFKATGIPDSTTILYPGDLEKAMQPGSDFAQEAGVNKMPFTNRVFIEIDENYETDRFLSMAVHRPENLFIFRDDRIETNIKPTYSSTDVTINFKYRAIDKTSAVRWRDEIRTRIAMMWDTRIHELQYHYLIPQEFLYILKELYRMREAVAGYGETYEQYFENNVSQRASIMTTQAGTQGMWGITETQLRVVGYFDFEGVPEQGSKEDEGDTWTISFSYKFKYDKPIACAMSYPLMIHNQMLDQKYRPNPLIDKADPLEGKIHGYTLSALDFSKFQLDKRELIKLQMPGIAIPEFDEFFPATVPDKTMRVFTGLVNIDLADPTFLLSLKDLGTITISPVILDFLIGEVPFLTKYRESVFTLNLYRSIDLQSFNSLTVDNDLNIRSKNELSLRDYYHIRFAIVSDLSLLSAAALIRLRSNAAALRLILNTIDPTLQDNGLLPEALGNNYVTRQSLQLAIDAINARTNYDLNGTFDKTRNNQIYGLKTVQSLTIRAIEHGTR